MQGRTVIFAHRNTSSLTADLQLSFSTKIKSLHSLSSSIACSCAPTDSASRLWALRDGFKIHDSRFLKTHQDLNWMALKFEMLKPAATQVQDAIISSHQILHALKSRDTCIPSDNQHLGPPHNPNSPFLRSKTLKPAPLRVQDAAIESGQRSKALKIDVSSHAVLLPGSLSADDARPTYPSPASHLSEPLLHDLSTRAYRCYARHAPHARKLLFISSMELAPRIEV
ncbi:hypothetical protein B0H14DRAFT_3443463 [Mycena olivaceomarginata]|nr:hypothetical protein B0H14DRAFT_3443463 [Mycena olivaceomarginata]